MPEVNFLSLSDARKWVESASFLHELVQLIPATDWLPVATASTGDLYPDEDEQQRVSSEISATLPPVVDECIKAILALLQKHQLSPLSEPAKYWTRKMLIGVADYCWLHAYGSGEKEPETLVAFPIGDRNEVLLKMLCDWWPSTGLREQVRRSTSKESLFYYFHAS